MTKGEAIGILIELASYENPIDLIVNHSVSVQDACHMAIKALEADTDGDLISREAAINVVRICHPYNMEKEIMKLPSYMVFDKIRAEIKAKSDDIAFGNKRSMRKVYILA